MDTFRMVYEPLTEAQEKTVEEVKSQAQKLLESFNSAVPTEERSERSRCMAIARTNLETAIMFAVKGITTNTG